MEVDMRNLIYKDRREAGRVLAAPVALQRAIDHAAGLGDGRVGFGDVGDLHEVLMHHPRGFYQGLGQGALHLAGVTEHGLDRPVTVGKACRAQRGNRAALPCGLAWRALGGERWSTPAWPRGDPLGRRLLAWRLGPRLGLWGRITTRWRRWPGPGLGAARQLEKHGPQE